MTELRVAVTNVGGIDDLEVTFEEGVSAISGPNASNKTSLLQAIAFGLGRRSVPIKTDAETARVELELDGEEIVRTARATEEGQTVSGAGWVTEERNVELLERFATLLEFSDVRQAVRTGGDVGALLKSPMNIDEMERERDRKLERKRELQASVEAADDVDERLAATREELADARENVADLESTLEDLRERQVEVSTDDDLSELRERRADLVQQRNEYERDVDQLSDAVDRLDERIAETAAEIEEAEATVGERDVDAIRAERQEVEAELAAVDDRIDVLQSVLTANREMLSSSYTGLLGQDSSLLEDEVTCWACGGEAAESDFEETLAALVDLVDRDKERRQEYRPTLRELDEEIEAAEAARRRLESLQREKRDLERQRERRAESLATKRDQLEAVRADLAALDEELAGREADRESEAVDVASEIESVRVDLHAARSEVDRLESALEEHRDRREQRAEHEARVEELTADIADLTDRIENLETELRASFNDAMDDLLAVLSFDRIERVWLDGSFDLVVARESDGVTTRDTVDHLSESERETIGLVLALAGYVAYDVSAVVPVLLMDTLGAFDAERTADLLSYFQETVPLLVVAVLPESAAAIDEATPESTLVRPSQDGLALQ